MDKFKITILSTDNKSRPDSQIITTNNNYAFGSLPFSIPLPETEAFAKPIKVISSFRSLSPQTLTEPYPPSRARSFLMSSRDA